MDFPSYLKVSVETITSFFKASVENINFNSMLGMKLTGPPLRSGGLMEANAFGLFKKTLLRLSNHSVVMDLLKN